MRYIGLLERSFACAARLRGIAPVVLEGHVTGLSGLIVDVDGLGGRLSVGDRLILSARDGHRVPAEVVGFRRGLAQTMPFGALDGLGPGSSAFFELRGISAKGSGTLAISAGWLGRVLDPLGRPLDNRGPLPVGQDYRSVLAPPPGATARARLGARLDLGIRALNCFATCRQGQRLGCSRGRGSASPACLPCSRDTSL